MLQLLKFVAERVHFVNGHVTSVSDLFGEFELWLKEPPLIGRNTFSASVQDCLKATGLPRMKYGPHRSGGEVVRGYLGMGFKPSKCSSLIPTTVTVSQAAAVEGVHPRTMARRVPDPDNIPLRRLRPFVDRLRSTDYLLEQSAMAAKVHGDSKAYEAITGARARLWVAAIAPPDQYSIEVATAEFLLHSCPHIFGVKKAIEYLNNR